MAKKAKKIPIGVVLDLKSTAGSMAQDCIFMALDDFYKQNSHYETRLTVRIRDSENDAVKAAFAGILFIFLTFSPHKYFYLAAFSLF